MLERVKWGSGDAELSESWGVLVALSERRRGVLVELFERRLGVLEPLLPGEDWSRGVLELFDHWRGARGVLEPLLPEVGMRMWGPAAASGSAIRGREYREGAVSLLGVCVSDELRVLGITMLGIS